MASSSLPQEIRNLPLADRIELVEQIWDSICEERTVQPLTAAQQAELDRRLALHQADPGRAVPWEEVKRRLTGE